MRNKFDSQLEKLNLELITMGALCEDAISASVKGFLDDDDALCRKAVEAEDEINRKERDIESICMKLLLEQQPVARDLRMVSSALKMITDMERIGDHAADISELTLMLDALPRMSNANLREMAAQTTEMLLHSLEAYVEQDMDKAHAVIAQDDAVDALFVAVKRDLVEAIRVDPQASEAAADLLMAAKYFERIGDHATNIAEWAIFAHTGHHAQA